MDLPGWHPYVMHLLIDTILLDDQALREQSLRCLVFKGILLEQMDVEHLAFLAHDAHGLVFRYFPLVYFAEFATPFGFVGLLDEVQEVVGVAKEEEKFMRHEVWDVVTLVLLFLVEVGQQLIFAVIKVRQHLVLTVTLSPPVKIVLVLLADQVLDHIALPIVPLEIRNDIVQPHFAEGIRDTHIDKPQRSLDLVVYDIEVILLGLAALQHKCVETVPDLLNGQPTFLRNGESRSD